MEADLFELRSSKPSVTSDYLRAVDPDIRFAHALALDILVAPAIEGGHSVNLWWCCCVWSQR